MNLFIVCIYDSFHDIHAAVAYFDIVLVKEFIYRDREREKKNRQTDRDRHRERATERQTERQTQKDRDREI